MSLQPAIHVQVSIGFCSDQIQINIFMSIVAVLQLFHLLDGPELLYVRPAPSELNLQLRGVSVFQHLINRSCIQNVYFFGSVFVQKSFCDSPEKRNT